MRHIAIRAGLAKGVHLSRVIPRAHECISLALFIPVIEGLELLFESPHLLKEFELRCRGAYRVVVCTSNSAACNSMIFSWTPIAFFVSSIPLIRPVATLRPVMVD